MTRLDVVWLTPDFDPADPLVSRCLTMRPSLWTVLFAIMQQWSNTGNWYQDDPTHATVDEVIAEIINATDNAVFAGCSMIGQILELTVNTIPGWLLPCDGTEYLGTDYPELWAVIHDNLKTDADHFRTPDRVRRIGWGEAVGDQEGGETHTLTIGELTPHTHVYANAGLPDVPVVGPGEVPVNAFSGADDTGSTGGGDAFSVIQPVEGAQFYIIASTPLAV